MVLLYYGFIVLESFFSLSKENNMPKKVLLMTLMFYATISVSSAQGSSSSLHTLIIEHFGDGTGYQPKVKVDLPANVCDERAFEKGFKDVYLQEWDQFITNRIQDTQLLLKKSSQPQQQKNRLAYYQEHLIGAKGSMGSEKDYHIMPNCSPFDSYQAGQDLAMQLAVAAEKSLEQ